MGWLLDFPCSSSFPAGRCSAAFVQRVGSRRGLALLILDIKLSAMRSGWRSLLFRLESYGREGARQPLLGAQLTAQRCNTADYYSQLQ